MNINVTLLGQMISFALLVWFTMKFVWPPLTKAMADRQTRIADGLAAAERAKQDLTLAQKRAAEMIGEARGEATRIIEQANRRSAEIADEAKEQARAEGARQIASARVEIEQMLNKVREDLRMQTSAVAVAAATRILEREIDGKTHGKLIDDLVKQI